jgi:dTDP-4-dehydrorhamnose 3,5-epimerase-like enzyme
VAWDDPAIAADWGLAGEPILSERDRGNPRRSEIEPMWQPHSSLRT